MTLLENTGLPTFPLRPRGGSVLLPPRTLLPLGYSVLKGSPHYIWFCCNLTHPFSLLLTTNPHDSSVGKKTYQQGRRHQLDSWVRNIPWRRDRLPTLVFLGFPCGSAGKESVCNAETWVQSLGWEGPLAILERLPTPVFWPGEFHGLCISMWLQRVRHD